MKLAALVLSWTLCFAGLALAQTPVGKALVEGKVVTLFDDGTWQYAGQAATGQATGCDQVAPLVEFCAAALGWTVSTESSPEINAAYRIDARHYAQYIVEDLGTDDGLTAEFMRQVVLDNAQNATGNKPEVIDVLPVTLGALSGDTVVYKAKINGVNVIFANSVFLRPKLALQIMTYAIAGEYSPEHAGYQADLLANTKILE
jgi:hypothetical protein